MANSSLVSYLLNREVLRSSEVIDAFMMVDRSFFVPIKYLDEAYEDYSLLIGDGQVMTQPSTAAIMLELLEAKEGDFVMEIGAGSGWLTAILARLVGDQGFVYSYEVNRIVGEFCKSNLARFILNNYSLKIADAKKYWYDNAPYNRIISSTQIEDEEVGELVDLLVPGGNFVFLNEKKDLKLVKKDRFGNITEKVYSGSVFVPLQ